MEFKNEYLGKLEDIMPTLPSKSVRFSPNLEDVKNIITMYCEDLCTLATISRKFNTNSHSIKRTLLLNNIQPCLVRKSVKVKDLISINDLVVPNGSGGANKGYKQSTLHVYKNMRAHLKYDVTIEWLIQFEDIEKLKFLNRSITKERNKVNFNSQSYIYFIEHFYNDSQFNTVYKNWLVNPTKWMKPSLDHIIPRCEGGSLSDLNNLQFLTWFENRCKCNISMNEWCTIKKSINEYLILC